MAERGEPKAFGRDGREPGTFGASRHPERVSVQVLQEFYVHATRSTRSGRLSHEQAASLVEAWLPFPAQDTTVPIMQAAAATAHLSRISYWDAAVIEAARALGCETVLSEDLADGRDYGGVHVENPFRSST
jgi:predicted nucleic acid-binding protein